jgi:chromate transporter
MLDRPESSGSGDRVPLSDLFIGFLKVSLSGFGGGLVWARRAVVEQRRWMDEQEFAETLTLCQLMPGPNIVGITVCVGAKLRGAIGAIAGFILVPWTVGLTIGGIVLRNAEIAMLQNILSGLSASAAGLLIGTGLRLLTPQQQSPHGIALCRFGFRRHGIHQAAAADRAACIGSDQHRGCRPRKRESAMNSSSATLVLAAHLAVLSPISFGGFPTVLPDVHDFAVAKGWVTDQEFAISLRSRK